MIRKVQHDITLHYHICHTAFSQHGVIKWLAAFTLAIKNLVGEIHEMPEIMNPSPWNQVVSFCQIQALKQVLQQAGVHFLIIYKSHGLSLSTILQALFN